MKEDDMIIIQRWDKDGNHKVCEEELTLGEIASVIAGEPSYGTLDKLDKFITIPTGKYIELDNSEQLKKKTSELANKRKKYEHTLIKKKSD